jgi:hypothetical protein
MHIYLIVSTSQIVDSRDTPVSHFVLIILQFELSASPKSRKFRSIAVLGLYDSVSTLRFVVSRTEAEVMKEWNLDRNV